MSTCFMLMNNPIDLVMDLVVNPMNTNHQTSLEGAIEKYKVDFDVDFKQTIFTFKLFDDVKLYKLRIVADMYNSYVYLTKLGADGGVHMFHGWLED